MYLLLTMTGILDVGMFLLTVSMHAARKTATLLGLYILQSLLVTLFFVASAYEQEVSYLYVVAGITFLIKVVLIPVLYTRLLRRLQMSFASDTYLTTPWTFVGIFGIAVLSFAALHATLPAMHFGTLSPVVEYAPLHLAGILSALFLVVNRKAAFSQIIALLALENWIVFVASLAGFHQPLAVEVAVTLEIVVLTIIASTFILTVFERFGTIDISKMTHLTEVDE